MAPINRNFALFMGGEEVGEVTMSAEARPEAEGEEKPAIKLITVPTKTVNDDGSWFLLWMEDVDGSAETMIWTPETDQEIEDATAFYEAARRHEHVSGATGPAEIPDDAEPWLRALLDPESAERTEEEEALLKAILEAPEAEAPLLKYADWLTAQGSPQGEFIRVDAELERMEIDDPDRPPLDEKWSDLYEAHAESFVSPLRPLGLMPVMVGMVYPALALERGVIGRVEVETSGILPEQLDELFSYAPLVSDLTLDFEDVALEEFAAHPRMAQIRSLTINNSDSQLTPDRLRAMAESPHWKRLRELEIAYYGIGVEGAKELARAAFLPQLRKLSLRSCSIGAEGWDALSREDRLSALETLDLGSNELNGSSLEALAACRSLGRLRTLSLNSNREIPGGLEALSKASFLKSLKSLDLGSCSLTGADVAALVKCPFAQLEELNLSCNELGDAALRELLSAPWLSQLKDLDLDYNELKSSAGAMLAEAGFGELEKLKLASMPLEDAGVAAIAGSRNLAKLQELNVSGCSITSEGARAIAEADWPELSILYLQSNEIGPDGAAALAGIGNYELSTLWVDEEAVGEEGKETLEERYGDDVTFH